MINMQSQRSKQYILIGGAVAGMLLLILLSVALGNHKTTPNSVSAPQYTGNQNPKADYMPNTTATVDGLDALVNTASFTLDQMTAVRTAFQSYQPFNNGHTQISIATNDLQAVPPSQSDPLYRPSVLSHITVNQGAIYSIKIYFWGTSSIELLIYNGTTQLFDSGTVVGQS